MQLNKNDLIDLFRRGSTTVDVLFLFSPDLIFQVQTRFACPDRCEEIGNGRGTVSTLSQGRGNHQVITRIPVRYSLASTWVLLWLIQMSAYSSATFLVDFVIALLNVLMISLNFLAYLYAHYIRWTENRGSNVDKRGNSMTENKTKSENNKTELAILFSRKSILFYHNPNLTSVHVYSRNIPVQFSSKRWS